MRKLTILDYLISDAKEKGQNVAIIEEDKAITYQELYAMSLALGKGIVNAWGTRKKPIDIKTPLERFEAMLETLQDYMVVTSAKWEKTLLDMGYTGQYFLYDRLLQCAPGNVYENEMLRIAGKLVDTDIMYIIFTSGSTGVPKGVATSHRALVDYVDAFLEEIGMEETDICGNQAPFYADIYRALLLIGRTP